MRFAPILRTTSHESGKFQVKIYNYSENADIFRKVFYELDDEGYSADLEIGHCLASWLHDISKILYQSLIIRSKIDQSEEDFDVYIKTVVSSIRERMEAK